MISIDYDSYNMQANGVTTSNIQGLYGAPPRDLQIENIAGADGGVLVDSKFRPRTISVSGTITGATQLELETRITLFNRAMNKVEKELRIEDEGSFIVYTATPGVIQVERPRGLTKADFAVEFTCSNPIGLEKGVLTLLSDTYTTATAQSAINVLGSYQADPVISMTLNSFTGSGDQSITIRNAKNFAGITITRTWTAGDEIEIDCGSLDVTVNGSLVDYSGLFPSWQPGDGTVTYEDTLTTRDVDITMTYNKRKI